ncbi:MAG: sugar isomerase domain-containing protein, partial [Micromonosporaceae bacterium]
AQRLYELAPVHPEDVFVIASNSGINGSVVEFAQLVKAKGHRLIAVTSAEQSAQLPARHPSGRRLYEFADVVLDNGAPYGDAALPLPGGGSVCAISSITGALLAQMLTAEVVRRLLESGHTPPVYLSANVPGGDEHNTALESRYAGRIRRTA